MKMSGPRASLSTPTAIFTVSNVKLWMCARLPKSVAMESSTRKVALWCPDHTFHTFPQRHTIDLLPYVPFYNMWHIGLNLQSIPAKVLLDVPNVLEHRIHAIISQDGIFRDGYHATRLVTKAHIYGLCWIAGNDMWVTDVKYKEIQGTIPAVQVEIIVLVVDRSSGSCGTVEN